MNNPEEECKVSDTILFHREIQHFHITLTQAVEGKTWPKAPLVISWQQFYQGLDEWAFKVWMCKRGGDRISTWICSCVSMNACLGENWISRAGLIIQDEEYLQTLSEPSCTVDGGRIVLNSLSAPISKRSSTVFVTNSYMLRYVHFWIMSCIIS